MTAQKSGGGPSGRKPTALAGPENHHEPEAAAVKGNTKTALSNGLALHSARFAHRHPTITVAAGLLILSAGILAAGPIADHLPDLVLGACIVALGIVCGAMLAVRA